MNESFLASKNPDKLILEEFGKQYNYYFEDYYYHIGGSYCL